MAKIILILPTLCPRKNKMVTWGNFYILHVSHMCQNPLQIPFTRTHHGLQNGQALCHIHSYLITITFTPYISRLHTWTHCEVMLSVHGIDFAKPFLVVDWYSFSWSCSPCFQFLIWFFADHFILACFWSQCWFTFWNFSQVLIKFLNCIGILLESAFMTDLLCHSYGCSRRGKLAQRHVSSREIVRWTTAVLGWAWCQVKSAYQCSLPGALSLSSSTGACQLSHSPPQQSFGWNFYVQRLFCFRGPFISLAKQALHISRGLYTFLIYSSIKLSYGPWLCRVKAVSQCPPMSVSLKCFVDYLTIPPKDKKLVSSYSLSKRRKNMHLPMP